MPKQTSAAVQSTPKPKKKTDKAVETSDNAPNTAQSEVGCGSSDKTSDSNISVTQSDNIATGEIPTSPRKDASTDPIELSGGKVSNDD